MLGVELFEGFESVGGDDDLEACALQDFARDELVDGIVLGKEDPEPGEIRGGVRCINPLGRAENGFRGGWFF